MKKVNIIVLLLIFSNTLFSQQIKVVRDIGLWGGINIKKELSEDFEINLEQQIRIYTNVSEFDDYIVDLGGKYKMNKNFKLGTNLRYTYNAKKWKDAENNYRYNLDLNYNGKLTTKLKLHYRFRYQQEFVNLLSEFNTTNINYSDVRNKIQIELKVNTKNEIYVSGELFRLRQLHREPYFNKMRFYVGDKLKTKIGKFNYSLGYEQELNANSPASFFFFKTIFTLKL